jgi:hypothetical protein
MPGSEPMERAPAQENEIRFGTVARPGEIDAHVMPDRPALHDENAIGELAARFSRGATAHSWCNSISGGEAPAVA